MADGRESAEWARLSVTLAQVATIHRDPRKHPKPVLPIEMNLYELGKRARNQVIPRAGVGILKDAFVRLKGDVTHARHQGNDGSAGGAR